MLVKAALALDIVSTNYQVEMKPEEAQLFFRGEFLNNLIEEINSLAPRVDFGIGNPNTGRMFHSYRVGKEYSRVLYIEMVKVYNTKANYADIASQILEWGRVFGADEKDIVCDDDTLTIRLWWD